mmetsp:Transcript_66460/g.163844  ORF Transcript_66460/g.163844 Transcript_66460/m.163844 type:complete len:273 (-) Transcript_66460:231-1049(-)
MTLRSARSLCKIPAALTLAIPAHTCETTSSSSLLLARGGMLRSSASLSSNTLSREPIGASSTTRACCPLGKVERPWKVMRCGCLPSSENFLASVSHLPCRISSSATLLPAQNPRYADLSCPPPSSARCTCSLVRPSRSWKSGATALSCSLTLAGSCLPLTSSWSWPAWMIRKSGLTCCCAPQCSMASLRARLRMRDRSSMPFFSSLSPVSGLVSCPLSNQSWIAFLSYVCPSTVDTGSSITSIVTGHRKLGGTLSSILAGSATATRPPAPNC